MNDRKNYLGIDWGSAKVGLALGHAETGVALAFSTLLHDEDLMGNLMKIIREESVGVIVVGIPAHNALHNESGKPSHKNQNGIEHEGEKFGKKLQDFIPGIVVAYQNEMFTTRMAQANLIDRGEKHVGKHDDAEAARIILQEWMDKNAD